MIKYIHLGYPKNFSTSLQRDYFSKHPDLYHLGIGLENNLGYRDSTVEKTLEVYLKSCKYFKYKEVEKHIQDHFQDVFLKSKNQGYRAVGISAEHLSFAFTYDGLGANEKSERLFKIFGPQTKVIMIIRNQFDLIKSLYREYVRVGFAGDFSHFVKFLYKYQDRNFVYDLRYDYVYKTYSSLFGNENVGLFFFENYRNDKGQLIKVSSGMPKLYHDLNTFLGLSQTKMEFGHYNEAIPSNKVTLKAKLNQANTHDIGNSLMETAEKHRIKKYLEEDLNFFEEEHETYSDVQKKRFLIKQTLDSKLQQPLSYDVDKKFSSFFKRFYEYGNSELAKSIEIELPKAYANLKF
ncbi:MAG: hypothetical protein GYB35_13855 [Algicola sp.]|nr:hypothetical protein [Algicola sp.]